VTWAAAQNGLRKKGSSPGAICSHTFLTSVWSFATGTRQADDALSGSPVYALFSAHEVEALEVKRNSAKVKPHSAIQYSGPHSEVRSWEYRGDTCTHTRLSCP